MREPKAGGRGVRTRGSVDRPACHVSGESNQLQRYSSKQQRLLFSTARSALGIETGPVCLLWILKEEGGNRVRSLGVFGRTNLGRTGGDSRVRTARISRFPEPGLGKLPKMGSCVLPVHSFSASGTGAQDRREGIFESN